MSIKTPSECSDPSAGGCQQTRPVTEGSPLPEVEDDSGDRLSISSVSPSPKQDPPLSRLTPDGASGEANRPGVTSLSLDSLGNMALRTSPPLASIREMDEAEEPGSGRGSRGDGMVRGGRGPAADGDSPDLELERRDSEVLSHPGFGVGGARGPCCLQTPESAVLMKSGHVVNLNGTLTDVAGSPRDLTDDGCPLECHRAPENSPVVKSSSLNTCGIQQRLIDHNAAEQSVEASDPNALESSLILLAKAHDLNAKSEDQSENISLCSETVEKDSSEREGGHIGTRLTILDKVKGRTHTVTNKETDMSKGSLVEVLTACKSKVEQLEKLKQSSHELTTQLQSAQAVASGLQCRVQWLERQRSLNQREMEDLLGELAWARGALEEKNAEMGRASAQIQLLQLRLEERQQNVAAGDSEDLANGHTTIDASQPPRQNSNDSRVCRLL